MLTRASVDWIRQPCHVIPIQSFLMSLHVLILGHAHLFGYVGAHVIRGVDDIAVCVEVGQKAGSNHPHSVFAFSQVVSQWMSNLFQQHTSRVEGFEDVDDVDVDAEEVRGLRTSVEDAFCKLFDKLRSEVGFCFGCRDVFLEERNRHISNFFQPNSRAWHAP